ncbi:MAG: FAD-binding protein, partial [Bacteroidales bacterium]|nr:FAD-binding protein [Bacteroidales bacterium]
EKLQTKYCNGYDNVAGIGIVSEPDVTEEADIVAVGSGIAGFMASMIAKEQAPDLKVVLLEKNGYWGGSTLLAECNGPATMKTPEEARAIAAAHIKSTGYIAHPMLWYEQAIDAGYNSAWLFGKHRVGWYQNMGPAFYEGGNGASCINKYLAPDAEALGIDMRKSARAKALVMQDEYTCTGVQYIDADGKIVQINAKAVILCTGGISTNKALLSYYTSQDLEKTIGWGVGQDGDGQLMAEQTAHGRANHLTVSSMFNNVDGLAYDSKLGVAGTMQYSDLFVNEDGIRFADESQGDNLGSTEGGKMIETEGYVWSILDQSMVQKYEAGGCTRHYSGFADVCVGAELEIQSEIEMALADEKLSKLIFKADTVEELAEKIGVDPAAFAETIANYNRYAETGVDEEWGKPAQYLWPCDTAPFYALRVSSGMVNTNGGIRINRNAQVVDARFKPVVGLYAAGVCTSGWDNELYGGGSCQTVGMWAGSKAARHALENLCGVTVAEDWYGELAIALCRAACSYDESKGCAFSTLAYKAMFNAMAKQYRDH